MDKLLTAQQFFKQALIRFTNSGRSVPETDLTNYNKIQKEGWKLKLGPEL